MTKETPKQTIARLRENLKHIAGQLAERTAELQDAKEKLAASFTENITYANSKVDRMGERKPYKLIAITAGIAFGMGVIVGAVV
jgi:ElaB/YqjD/DUF883 family membrane-anchored ribosome-binding protein